MIRWISIMLLAIILMSCASEPKHYAPAVKNAKTYHVENPEVSLPAWVLSPPPSQNHVIGIAYRGADSIESARNQAAVILSRNRSSYTVKRNAVVKTDTDYSSNEDKAEIEINVSTSPNSQDIFNRLNLLHDSDFDGYSICLFSTKSGSADTTLVTYDPDIEPEWIDRFEVMEHDGYITAIASSSSSDLINAYETALVDARLTLAQYQNHRVQAMKKFNDNDAGGKIITSAEFETLERLEKLAVSKMHIRRKYCSGLYSYVVYIEMRMQV